MGYLNHQLISLFPHDVRRWSVRCLNRKFAKYGDELRAKRSDQDYSVLPMLSMGALLVHIPKCAGISFSRALFHSIGPGHLTIRSYEVILTKKEYDSCFKFTIVRNPWDRLFSAYTFLMKGGMADNDVQFRDDILSKYPDFEQFVLRGLEDLEVLNYYHFLPQEHYLRNYRGKVALDFIGRFEQLQEDFKYITDKLGVSCELNHYNKTNHRVDGNYREAYNPRMQKRVEDVYRADVELLGYEF